MSTIVEKAQAFGLNRVLSYMDNDYITNIPKTLNWLEHLDTENVWHDTFGAVREVLEDAHSNWNCFIGNIYSDLDKETRRMLLKNFIVNASVVGRKRRTKVAEKEHCNVPWAVLMDPTSACNLKCKGCWAAEYGNKLSMGYETLDRIICQGKDLGIYMYIYSGGEPLIRKDDIIKLCDRHSDCVFLAFTNGTLIDEKFAKEMARVHNFIPAISIEGFEKSTDFRRGVGTYKRVIEAMKILKEHRQPFGISTCYTSKNVEEVGSDEYIDAMISMGAKFCWYFTFLPVGKGSPTDLMANDQQRKFMYNQVRRFRKEKPIFIIDFWNDGEYIDGCIAGGRQYLHINAGGDVEPCAFIHYSNVNINKVSLLEALKSPIFAEYRKEQPFNENKLRPCPLLDNPDSLVGIVKRSGAHSTDVSCPEEIESLAEKTRPAAARWAVTAEEIWQNSPAGQKCAGCAKAGDMACTHH